jgi:hypothetical protein
VISPAEEPMPYKHNQSRRHKIGKARYKVTNWPEYNKALRQRGDITIWFTEEALAAWHPAKTGARGRPLEYSDLAIETALFIRQVFRLPLRQTEGFMNSLTRLMKSTISIPDYSSVSKRSISLPRHVLSQTMEPGSLVIVDATGLKVYGKDEWHQEKHDVAARRPGASSILRSTNIIKLLPANSPRQKSVIRARYRICSPKSSPPLRPSWATVHTMVNRFLKRS